MSSLLIRITRLRVSRILRAAPGAHGTTHPFATPHRRWRVLLSLQSISHCASPRGDRYRFLQPFCFVQSRAPRTRAKNVIAITPSRAAACSVLWWKIGARRVALVGGGRTPRRTQTPLHLRTPFPHFGSEDTKVVPSRGRLGRSHDIDLALQLTLSAPPLSTLPPFALRPPSLESPFSRSPLPISLSLLQPQINRTVYHSPT